MKFQKYIKRLPALSFMIMLLCAGIFLSSCEDDEVISDDVVLESFGPSGVKHGETIKFIGRNLDKVTAIELPNATVNKEQFTTHTSGLIELAVPKQAQAGKVVLKTPKGDVASRAMLSFEVPVVIESITAEARPGSDITIRGDMVNWIEEIVFSDGVSVTEFVSSSLDELVVTVPMEAQTGYLIFKSGGTNPLSFVSEDELIVTVPTVTELNPATIKHTESLTIAGTNLDLITGITFAGVEDEVTEFESQSENSIVVKVPAQAVKGTLSLHQASPVDVITSQELTIILPVATEISPKPAVPGEDEVTITGTNLDLVAQLTFSGVDPVAAANFKSHTAEQIVVALPEGARAGAVRYTTIHGYSAGIGVNVTLPGPQPDPLAITLYDGEFHFGGGDWSWGSISSDPSNTEQAHIGTMSWKFATDGGGGAKSGGMSGVDASEMGVFVFSLYGGPGTDGKQVAAVLGSDGADKWDSYNAVTLVEGEWTEYRLDLSRYPTVNLKNITIFIFKLEGASAGEVIYVDRVGFDPAGPPPPPALQKVIYDDDAHFEFSKWGGWDATSDFNSTEKVRQGEKAIKVEYTKNWGGGAQFGDKGNVLTDGTTHFAFSIFGEEGTNGKQIKVLLKSDDGEHEKFIEVVEGEWTDVAIPLSELGDPVNIKELFFQNAEWTGIVHFDFIGLR